MLVLHLRSCFVDQNVREEIPIKIYNGSSKFKIQTFNTIFVIKSIYISKLIYFASSDLIIKYTSKWRVRIFLITMSRTIKLKTKNGNILVDEPLPTFFVFFSSLINYPLKGFGEVHLHADGSIAHLFFFLDDRWTHPRTLDASLEMVGFVLY